MSAPGFTGSPLDRVEIERVAEGTIALLRGEPGARLLDLADFMPGLAEAGGLRWSPLAADIPTGELILLGRIDGQPHFARLAPDLAPARRTPELMTLLGTLPAGEAATYAVARSLLDWHVRHRFCAFCGSATAPARAGWMRRCPACATEHFPRTDPVVIMLAQHGEGAAAKILVGRQPAFPPGRYSALAGFVEVGESLEEAVRRELREEAGVVAGTVRYVASQPWPFPSQLMIACVADVADDALALDTAELEDAKWIDRAGVVAALAGAPDAPFLAPPRYAIAHTLFKRWAAEG